MGIWVREPGPGVGGKGSVEVRRQPNAIRPPGSRGLPVPDSHGEDEPVQVGTERVGVVSGVAGEGLQAAGESLFLPAG